MSWQGNQNITVMTAEWYFPLLLYLKTRQSCKQTILVRVLHTVSLHNNVQVCFNPKIRNYFFLHFFIKLVDLKIIWQTRKYGRLRRQVRKHKNIAWSVITTTITIFRQSWRVLRRPGWSLNWIEVSCQQVLPVNLFTIESTLGSCSIAVGAEVGAKTCRLN